MTFPFQKLKFEWVFALFLILMYYLCIHSKISVMMLFLTLCNGLLSSFILIDRSLKEKDFKK